MTLKQKQTVLALTFLLLGKATYFLPAVLAQEVNPSAASVFGRVIDAKGEPIPGVQVQTTAVVAESSKGQFEIVRCNATGSDGQFGFSSEKMPTAPIIAFSKNGYVNRWVNGRANEAMQVRMNREFMLAGSVKAYHGDAVDNASVMVVAMNEDTMPKSTYLTNDQGNFQIDGLSSTPLRLVFSSEKLAPKAVIINSDADNAEMNVRLQPGARVRFLVSDQQGNPIKDVDVAMVSWQEQPISPQMVQRSRLMLMK